MIMDRYSVSRSFVYDLMNDMREADKNPAHYIIDDRVKLVDSDALEAFWRKRHEKKNRAGR